MLYDKNNNNDDDVDDDDGDYYDNDDDYDVGNDFRPPKLFLALSDTLFFMIQQNIMDQRMDRPTDRPTDRPIDRQMDRDTLLQKCQDEIHHSCTTAGLKFQTFVMGHHHDLTCILWL